MANFSDESQPAATRHDRVFDIIRDAMNAPARDAGKWAKRVRGELDHMAGPELRALALDMAAQILMLAKENAAR